MAASEAVTDPSKLTKHTCCPRYGKCIKGKRYVPVQIIDVAGLVPGASEGRGLGNKFLDDLRHAHILLHIVDVSGTTNEKGEATEGYDPTKDIEWLLDEINLWIFNNLWVKMPRMVRKVMQGGQSPSLTIQKKLSGYGTNLPIVMKALAKMGFMSDADIKLDKWDEDLVRRFVATFVETRFPLVIVLNKIDHKDADRNISRICKRHPHLMQVPTSALAECYLRKLHQEGFISYEVGSEDFITRQDQIDSGRTATLKPVDATVAARLEKLKDLLLRHGSTGVQEAIQTAVNTLGYFPVFPVSNLNNFTSGEDATPMAAFRDCFLVTPGITVRGLADELWRVTQLISAEGVGAAGTTKQMSEDEVLSTKNNIVRYVVRYIPRADPNETAK